MGFTKKLINISFISFQLQISRSGQTLITPDKTANLLFNSTKRYNVGIY